MLTTSIHLSELVYQIGNAYMDGDTDNWGLVDSAWHHAIISDNLYSDFKKNCDFRSSAWWSCPRSAARPLAS